MGNQYFKLHAVFFIIKSVKSKQVMFLIFQKNLHSFCFLAEEKMMVQWRAIQTAPLPDYDVK